MGKQLEQPVKGTKRTSNRPIRKKKKNSDQEDKFSQQGSEENSNGEGSESDSGEQDSDNQESGSEEEESESTPQIDPNNLAVRNMSFREKRGTKMNYLIRRKKEEEDEDPFWAQQGQNYFGNLDDGDDDEQDYQQSSSGRDEFDSDFDQTESEHEQEQAQGEKQQVDEDQQKAKKKRQELMRKIHAPAPTVKKAVAQKTNVSTSTAKKDKVEIQKRTSIPEPASRYIHEIFNQQELLGEAATTEYFNWLSLKKLVSLDADKKDFTTRSHHIQGPKITYRNRLNEEGISEVTYELQKVEAKEISDLTKFMNHK